MRTPWPCSVLTVTPNSSPLTDGCWMTWRDRLWTRNTSSCSRKRIAIRRVNPTCCFCICKVTLYTQASITSRKNTKCYRRSRQKRARHFFGAPSSLTQLVIVWPSSKPQPTTLKPSCTRSRWNLARRLFWSWQSRWMLLQLKSSRKASMKFPPRPSTKPWSFNASSKFIWKRCSAGVMPWACCSRTLTWKRWNKVSASSRVC